MSWLKKLETCEVYMSHMWHISQNQHWIFELF